MRNGFRELLESVEASPLLSSIFFTPSSVSPISHFMAKSASTRILLGSLRGIGQVAYALNALSGIAIFVGCALSNPPAAILGFIGSLITTVLAYVIPHERHRATQGLHGYNGFLVGMGVGYFDAKLVIDNYDWVQFSRLLVPTICISVFCSLTHFMLCTMKSPPFTFAYNITLSVWLAFAISLGPQSIYSTNIEPYSVTPVEYDSIDFGWFINAVLSGIGQVFFAPDFVSSLIILGGLCLASPLIALFAFSGSFIATGIAVITHSAKTGIEFGLDGYSSVLAAIALGGYYYVPSWGSFLYLIVGSIFCVPMRRVFQSLFIHPFGPALTFPFCLVASIMYLASLSTKWPRLVDKQFLSFPERHLIPSPTVNKNDSHTNLELINSA